MSLYAIIQINGNLNNPSMEATITYESLNNMKKSKKYAAEHYLKKSLLQNKFLAT